MDNLVPMTIFHRTDHLLEKSPRFILIHLATFHNVIEQLVTRVFDHHDDVRRGRYHLVQLDDVRMSQHLEILNLPLDAIRHVHVLNLLLAQDLHGHFVTRDAMRGDLDFTKGAGTERFAELVLTYSDGFRGCAADDATAAMLLRLSMLRRGTTCCGS